jgi:hypothetical protein
LIDPPSVGHVKRTVANQFELSVLNRSISKRQQGGVPFLPRYALGGVAEFALREYYVGGATVAGKNPFAHSASAEDRGGSGGVR